MSQKRLKEPQPVVVSKKHKPNRKSLGVPPKKNRKTGKPSHLKRLQYLLPPYILTDFRWIKRMTFCFFFCIPSAVFPPPANSSDSEDQSVVEGTAKQTASKNNMPDVKAVTSPKLRGRSPPSSHKYHKQGDPDHSQHRDHHGRSPRVYKWSFQMCKCYKIFLRNLLCLRVLNRSF